jgi:hypothetical protein
MKNNSTQSIAIIFISFMFAKGAVCHQPLTEMERSRLLWLQFVAATIWLTLFIVDCS